MLKPIKPKRYSDQVFDQLRDLIYKGHFKPGEQLMPERELAQALGVSRPTLREALNKLVNLGLVEHRQGQGTFVGSPSDSVVKNPLAAAINGHDISLVELLEVRLGLECNAAGLAARRATPEDILGLEESVGKMMEEVSQGGLGSDADISFHMGIAFATKNMVQVQIMRSLYDLLFYGIKQNLRRLYSEPSTLDIIMEQHSAVLQSIRGHDSDAAFEAMRRHITYVMDFFHEQRPA